MKKFLLLFLLSCSALAQQGIFPGTGSGGGTPCLGVVNGIQYNNAGAFGCNAALTFNPATGVVTASGYATGSATQGYLALTQVATAAPAAPANTFRFLAPQSGLTSSYDVTVPLLAPTSNNSVMLVPNGGGQAVWGAVPLLTVPNTWAAPQTISVNLASGVTLLITNSSTVNLASLGIQSAGGHQYQWVGGGTDFAATSFYMFDFTSGNIAASYNGTAYNLQNVGVFGWAPTNLPTSSADTGLSRCGTANVVCVGNGTQGNSSGLIAAQAFESGGTKFSVSGCGTATSLVGGGAAGKFVGGSATCTPVVTMGGSTANNGFACHMNDFTTPTALFQESATTTTTATFTAGGTVGATDTINFVCVAY